MGSARCSDGGPVAAPDSSASLGSLVARALPLLLLFNTFLFINAEVWEMAGTLDGPAYLLVIFTFFALGAAFALSRVPGTIRGVNDFERWEDVDLHLVGTPAEPLIPVFPDGPARTPFAALRLRQRLNIALLVLFGQALQITFVTVALTGFFIGFGFLGITESTSLAWTRLDELQILFDTPLGDRQLVLSEPLIRGLGVPRRLFGDVLHGGADHRRNLPIGVRRRRGARDSRGAGGAYRLPCRT